MKKIFLAEDDIKLATLLLKSIKAEGYSVIHKTSVEEIEIQFSAQAGIDLIVLDRLMGEYDTKELIPRIKKLLPGVPIIIVSAINTPLERAELINLGADDYIGKPFHTSEFLARIRSLLRRIPSSDLLTRKIGKATLDLTGRKIYDENLSENLPTKEFQILNILSESPGRVFSRYDLLEKVWGNINYAETNLVEATVLNLRRRLSNLNCGATIRNQRNVGYWLET